MSPSIRVPPLDELVARWGEIAPLLHRCTAAEGGLYEPIDLLQLAMAGQVAFWLIEDGGLVAAAVCGVKIFPRKRVFEIHYVVGSRAREWWPLFMAEAERQARELGCAHVVSNAARPGWERFSARVGVKVRTVGVTIVRDL